MKSRSFLGAWAFNRSNIQSNNSIPLYWYLSMSLFHKYYIWKLNLCLSYSKNLLQTWSAQFGKFISLLLNLEEIKACTAFLKTFTILDLETHLVKESFMICMYHSFITNDSVRYHAVNNHYLYKDPCLDWKWFFFYFWLMIW